mgnify:CR=1 FL=1
MFILIHETSISSAHFLRDYKGICSRIHGHNWKIRVEIRAENLNKEGMAIDFKDLKNLTLQVLSLFDHQNLNDIPPFDKINPTAENIVKYFYKELKKILPDGIELIVSS